MLLHSGFSMGAGCLNSILMLAHQALYELNHLSSPLNFLDKIKSCANSRKGLGNLLGMVILLGLSRCFNLSYLILSEGQQ